MLPAWLSRLAIALTTPALAQQAQHEHVPASVDAVGTAGVSFQTSCAPALRQDFNRAVALLHSFWFAQAIASFNGVLEKDPSCAIAHWGIALSRWGNPFAGLRSPQQIALGREAIQKARVNRLADAARARLHRGRRGPLHRRRCRHATRTYPRVRNRAWNAS